MVCRAEKAVQGTGRMAREGEGRARPSAREPDVCHRLCTVKSMVSVTQERRIAATPAAVWYVIATPEMHEHLDPRCHLESTTGNGDVGSEYVLDIHAGRARARLRYVVVEAIPETRWAAEITLAGKDAGAQRAELLPEAEGTLLRWTVTRPAGRLTRSS